MKKFYGDQTYWGIGIVEDIHDPAQQGRVRVRIYGLHTDDHNELPTYLLPWSTVTVDATNAGVSGVGRTPTGLVRGSLVMGFFLDGKDKQDYMITSVITSTDTPVFVQGELQGHINSAFYGGSNPERLYNLLRDRFEVSENTAAAVVGTLAHAIGDPTLEVVDVEVEGKYGIGLWTPDQRRGLEEFSQLRGLDYTSFTAQVLYLTRADSNWNTLSVNNSIIDAQTVEEAANAVAVNVLRVDPEAAQDERHRYAREALGAYGSSGAYEGGLFPERANPTEIETGAVLASKEEIDQYLLDVDRRISEVVVSDTNTRPGQVAMGWEDSTHFLISQSGVVQVGTLINQPVAGLPEGTNATTDGELVSVDVLQPTQEALDQIKRWEGFEPRAYPDADGMSIGYGTFIDTPEEEYLRTATITEAEAQVLFERDIEVSVQWLRRHVRVPVTQSQFNALVSFRYNVRPSSAIRLIERLNTGNYNLAPYIIQYVNATMPSGERVRVPGLVTRRRLEADWFDRGNTATGSLTVRNHRSFTIAVRFEGGQSEDGTASVNSYTRVQWDAFETLVQALLARYPGISFVGLRDLDDTTDSPLFDVGTWVDTRFGRQRSVRPVAAAVTPDSSGVAGPSSTSAGGSVTSAVQGEDRQSVTGTGSNTPRREPAVRSDSPLEDVELDPSVITDAISDVINLRPRGQNPLPNIPNPFGNPIIGAVATAAALGISLDTLIGDWITQEEALSLIDVELQPYYTRLEVDGLFQNYTNTTDLVSAYFKYSDTIDKVSDVTVTAPVDGHYLRRNNAGQWVNTFIDYADITGTPGSGDFVDLVSNQAVAGIKNFTGTLRAGGNRVLTVADEGSGNGLDADSLDGQQGIYYLDWNNFTNKPALYSTANFNTDFATKTTSDLAEGSRLYFTNARVDARVTKPYVDALNVNADTLDGQHGTYYRNASNINAGTLADARLPSTMSGKTFTGPVSIIGSDVNNNFNISILGNTGGTTHTQISSGVSNGRFSVKASSDDNAPRFSIIGRDDAGAAGYALFDYGSTVADLPNALFLLRHYDTTGGFEAIRATGRTSLAFGAFTTFTVGGNTIWHAGNDGSGSGLDADLIDGVQLSQIARTDVAETFNSNLTIVGDLTVSGAINFVNSNEVEIGDSIILLNANETGVPTQDAGLEIERGTSPNVGIQWSESNDYWHVTADGTNWHKLITAADFGAGSGIDADLLDGQHGSFYQNASNLNAGTISDARLPSTMSSKTFSGDVTVNSPNRIASEINGSNATDTILRIRNTNATAPNDYWDIRTQADGTFALWGAGAERLAIGTNGGFTSTSSWNITGNLQQNGNNVWHSGNDGPSSGLNADQLDNQEGSFYQNASNLNAGTISNARLPSTISQSGYVEAGVGSGSVAMTVNDGYGNANLCFNHRSGIPDTNGSAARIKTFVDDTNGSLIFEVGDNVTSGVATNLSSVLRLYSGKIDALKNLDMNSYNILNANNINGVSVGTFWHAGNDGSGSGLDADTLDGYQASDFALVGAGDAGSVGGLTASQFLRSDVNDTFNGRLAIQRNSVYVDLIDTGVDSDDFAIHVNTDRFYVLTTNDATSGWITPHPLILYNSGNYGELYGNRILTVADEGSGNGLDADLLDGQHGSYYQNATNLNAGTISDARLPGTMSGKTFTGTLTANTLAITSNGVTTTSDIALAANAATNSQNSWSFGMTEVAGYYRWLFGNTSNTGGTSGGTEYARLDTAKFNHLNDIQVGGNSVWHAGNDGPSSGLNADQLDNQEGSFYQNASNINAGTLHVDRLPNQLVDKTFSSISFEGGQHHITTNDGGGNFNIRIGNVHGLANDGVTTNSIYTNNNSGAYHLNFAHDFSNPNPSLSFLMAPAPDTVSKVSGDLVNFTETLKFDLLGTISYKGNTVWHAGNDGSGSTLDADLLDGQEGSYYLPAASYTAADVLAKLITVDGPTSGLNADLLDGQHGSYYQNANNINAGTISDARLPGTLDSKSLSGTTYLGVDNSSILRFVSERSWRLYWSGTGATTQLTLRPEAVGKRFVIRNQPDTADAIIFDPDNLRMFVNGGLVWHSGNDGSGSGLDADLLDGVHLNEIFNNMGQYHGTYQDFNLVDKFGATYIQGSTNGPGTGSTQFYGFTLGLGSEHALSAYALQLAIPRYNSTDRYLSIRSKQNGTWEPWRKINAGYADNADLLDGQHGSFYQNASNLNAGTLNAARLPTSFVEGSNYTLYTQTGFDLTTATTGFVPTLEIRQNTAGDDALIKYHVIGDFAAYMGLSGGLNDFVVGGWSMGNTTENRIWHAGNDGSGSGLDADTVDGYGASSLCPYETAAITNIDAEFPNPFVGYITNTATGSVPQGGWCTVLTMQRGASTRQSQLAIDGLNGTGEAYVRSYNGTWSAWHKIWTTGNDGAGSGLDADLLDGLQPSTAGSGNTIAQRDASGHLNMNYGFSAYLNMSHGASERTSDTVFYSSTDNYIRKNTASGFRTALDVPQKTLGSLSAEINRDVKDTGIYTYNVNNAGLGNSTLTSHYSVLTWGRGASGSGQLAANWVDGGNELYFRSLRDTINNWWSWKKIWHDGNDGSGSGLDADRLDGYDSNFGAVGNTVAMRNGSADIYARLFRSTYQDHTSIATTASIVFRNSTSDNYLRAGTPTAFVNWLNAQTGVDADTVDGIHASSFARNSARTDGYLWVRRNSTGSAAYFTNQSTGTIVDFRSGGGDGSTRAYIANSGAIFSNSDITAYSSDIRLKENIVEIDSALDKISQLRGVSYDWKDECESLGFKPYQKHEHGLIAQEVQKIIPDAVRPAPFDENYLTVKYERVVPLLVEAVKEEKKKREALEDKVRKLEEMLKTLMESI